MGIHLGHDKRKCNYLNWEKNVEKMENETNLWRRRNLSIFGKSVVLKTLIISKLLFVSSILTFPPPDILQRINKLIFSFLWGNRERIKRKTLIGSIENGGVGMIDFESKIHSLKASWVQRIINNSNGY